MDRHDEASAGFIGYMHRLSRSAVRTNPGIVSADRIIAKSIGPVARNSSNESLSAVSPLNMMLDWQLSSLTSRNRVQRSRSRVRPAVITVAERSSR
jgi:hypothetical protein